MQKVAPSLLIGDLRSCFSPFDDEGMGLELLLRVFELIVAALDRVCVVVGNHDCDGNRFASSVPPSDFADFLTANWRTSGSSARASWPCDCSHGSRTRCSCAMACSFPMPGSP